METRDSFRFSHLLVPLGVVTITPRAFTVLTARQVNLLELLDRHRAGDWGEAANGYASANDESLRDGGDVISLFDLGRGIRLRITTEIRAATRIALNTER